MHACVYLYFIKCTDKQHVNHCQHSCRSSKCDWQKIANHIFIVIQPVLLQLLITSLVRPDHIKKGSGGTVSIELCSNTSGLCSKWLTSIPLKVISRLAVLIGPNQHAEILLAYCTTQY